MNNLRLESRRGFCRILTLGVATSLVRGKVLRQAILAEAQAEETPAAGVFKMKISDYPALASAPGSLVLNLPGATPTLATVVVTRLAGNQFFAVDSTCAHNQCTVNAYDAGLGVIRCTCHGSQYQANGQLVQGPAQRSLRAFTASMTGPDELTVLIPEMRFNLKTAKTQVVVGGFPRLQLSFPGLAFFLYQLYFRPNLQTAWAQIPFARFPGTALDTNDMPGIGADIQIYVAMTQPTGYYKIVALG